jgi:formylmethanofuran dehydrogenase subunit E
MQVAQQSICGKPRKKLLEAIEAFHGAPAPGLVLGAMMVELAQALSGAGTEADAIVESRHCLPDAVQLFTHCTIGNGRLKVMDWDKFALSLYDRRTRSGYRVWFDLEKAKAFPTLYNWYMRRLPKTGLPDFLLLEALFQAGRDVLSCRPVAVTSYHRRKTKKTIAVCPGCREPYPSWQGTLCRACQGEGYYEDRPEGESDAPFPAAPGPGAQTSAFKKLPVAEAIGKRLIHDITEIRKGEFKGPAFKKGHEIRREDISHFHRLGKHHVYVEIEEAGCIHENEAAEQMARAFCGPGVSWSGPPSEGKLKLKAQSGGLLKIETPVLAEINMLGDVMCATRRTDTLVQKGDTVAATRAIPLAVRREVVAQAVEIADAAGGLVSVKPLKSASVGILITGNEVYHQLIEDQFEAVLRSKVTELGSHVAKVSFAPDDAEVISGILERYVASGVDLILSSGGMSVDPDDVTRNGVLKAGGTNVTYGSPVLPGAMFLIAYIDGIPVLGVPACGMYHRTTVLDLVLPRVLAGERLERADIAALGHAGLCLDCASCRFPDCPLGKY